MFVSLLSFRFPMAARFACKHLIPACAFKYLTSNAIVYVRHVVAATHSSVQLRAEPMLAKLCRYVFCRWVHMLPIRTCPNSPHAISVYVWRFGGAANMAFTTRDLRTGMVFNRIKVSQLNDAPESTVHIALSGQWTPEGNTYQCDYLHPGYFNSLYAHQVSIFPAAPRWLLCLCVYYVRS